MDANSIAALLGLVAAFALLVLIGREIVEGLRLGRFVMRGPTIVTRQRQPAQFYVSLIYKLSLVVLCLLIALYSGGRLAGWWGAL